MIKRKRREKQNKEQIKKSAIYLFAKNGFEKTSVIDICNNANVNNAMVSYYFGGKASLYNELIKDSLQRQHELLNTLINIKDFQKLSKDKKISILYEMLNKFIDVLYQEVSSDLIMLLLREQQYEKSDFVQKPIIITYFSELIADILDLPLDSKQVIHISLSIITLIVFPKILSGISLNLLKQKNFKEEDIVIIKENLKKCLLNLVSGTHYSDTENKL